MAFFRPKWPKNRVLAKKNDLVGAGWGPIFQHYTPFRTQYLNHSRIFEIPDFDPPRVFEPPKLEFCKKKKKKKKQGLNPQCYKFPRNSFEKVYYRCLYVTICTNFFSQT